jgi:uncharacterized Zn-binding protein involved in type VI secretion
MELSPNRTPINDGVAFPTRLHQRACLRCPQPQIIAQMPPAARVGDMHVCPLVTGVVPHVGGPILPPGCPTVLIGGMPAARVGDMATCVGPPDAIVMGSTKVMIGGMPAARMGDSCAHGGTIVLGMPTVMIS